MPSPLITPLQVRYAECDMQGRVFNAHYLTWFDMANSDALRTITGFSYLELVERWGIELVAAESTLRWLAPARFDEALEVEATFDAPTTSSLTSHYTLRRGDAVLTTGTLRHVCVDAQTFQKAPWPEAFRAALLPFLPPA
jgi:acyl-CoA thioester hydrolase